MDEFRAELRDLHCTACNEMSAVKVHEILRRLMWVVNHPGIFWHLVNEVVMQRASRSANVLCLFVRAAYSSCKARALGVKTSGVEAHLSEFGRRSSAWNLSHIKENPFNPEASDSQPCFLTQLNPEMINAVRT